ncbi:lysosomal phospholipase A and acyltransferase isoform X27 [Macaca fascicularis]|uniref:lysosomal phospholipase A and acyltransferase isoform X27 n=1 Tax=Macaca fascicularis TaxID=9541 RepID=UPI003D15A956
MGLHLRPYRVGLLPDGLLFLLLLLMLLADPALPAGRHPPVVLGWFTTKHPGPPSFLMVWMYVSLALGRPSHWSSWTPAKAAWRQPQAWKDKYIRAFVSLGAPWGGVAKTLRVLASGDNNRIPVIGPLKIREQQRSAVSTSWLLPYSYTWSPEKVFVQTPTTNYTLRDYRRFFQDIGFEDGWLMRQDTEGLVEATMPPGVQLHCLYGTGVPTPDSFYYESFPDRDPKICFGDGDGTVNLKSALQCQAWQSLQEHQVLLQELPGSEHIEMLANATTLAYLKRVLLGP